MIPRKRLPEMHSTTFGERASQGDFDDSLEVGGHDWVFGGQFYQDDEDKAEQKGTPDRDDVPDNYFDQYLNAEVLLPKGGKMLTEKVKRRKLDNLGVPQGHRHSNPNMNHVSPFLHRRRLRCTIV